MCLFLLFFAPRALDTERVDAVDRAGEGDLGGGSAGVDGTGGAGVETAEVIGSAGALAHRDLEAPDEKDEVVL